MADENDPFCWTVDQVVNVICHSPSTPDAGSSRRPDVSFGATLQDQKIDGKMLLQEVNDVVLQKDLGLHVFGERKWVLNVIQWLQQKSGRHQAANVQGKYTIFKALDLPSR